MLLSRLSAPPPIPDPPPTFLFRPSPQRPDSSTMLAEFAASHAVFREPAAPWT